MRVASRRFALAALAAALPLAACSDSGPSGPAATQLQQAEAMAIYAELHAGAAAAMAEADMGNGDQPGSVNITVPCPGGTMAVALNSTGVLSQTGDGTVSVSWTQAPSGCRVTTGRGTYTVNGSPSITGTFTTQFSNWEPVGTITWATSGGFTYAGPVSGTCTMSMTYAVNATTFAGTVNGTMCGHALNQPF